MNYILLLTVISLLVSCQAPSSNEYNVQYKGALKNMMKKGDISANADLRELAGMKNLYALGAVENLKGEILILNGTPYISTVVGDSLNIDTSFDSKATLLGYAIVEDWSTHNIPDEVSNYEELEIFIENTMRDNGKQVNSPFPFLISGNLHSFDWHIIDWPEGDMNHTHEKHINSGLNGTSMNRDVEILGFYSKHHRAIFTHHTTNMHMHVKTKDGLLSGHLDDLLLGEKMILQLPL